jgi:hypothetical protein
VADARVPECLTTAWLPHARGSGGHGPRREAWRDCAAKPNPAKPRVRLTPASGIVTRRCAAESTLRAVATTAAATAWHGSPPPVLRPKRDHRVLGGMLACCGKSSDSSEEVFERRSVRLRADPYARSFVRTLHLTGASWARARVKVFSTLTLLTPRWM